MNLKGKKEYKKPEIRSMRLAPEEVVLAACKESGAVRIPGARCDDFQGLCINKAQGS